LEDAMNTCKRLSLALLLGLLLLPAADAHCRRRDDCCPPPPPQKVVLEVCHPCTHCKLEVPVCIPACCQGVPCVRFQNTLIGQGKTVFSWQCGHEVVVRYTRDGYRVRQHD
jgi:hypothetical protein